MTTERPYLDDYPTCARTYATLCVYPADQDVARVSRALGILPSRITEPSSERPAVKSGWFLSSRGVVASRDLRRHLDWLVGEVSPRAQQIEELRRSGARAVVSCYWLSAYGHGGPTISVSQMKMLAELGLDLELDFYSAGGSGKTPSRPG